MALPVKFDGEGFNIAGGLPSCGVAIVVDPELLLFMLLSMTGSSESKATWSILFLCFFACRVALVSVSASDNYL